ncbi:Probable RNA-directed DNA polymerase from transposon BS [Eumeta japonica]|uniref:Probable RNA-directed DNA polymerase from transposon BS n=1 Tax=Eumeta variegata TaxID=151549 RepID=A0A4C1Z5Z3_EUMVA|nr:Probable RNA-directed DNA polymerase from transposon BS [Eumeta japonica]
MRIDAKAIRRRDRTRQPVTTPQLVTRSKALNSEMSLTPLGDPLTVRSVHTEIKTEAHDLLVKFVQDNPANEGPAVTAISAIAAHITTVVENSSRKVPAKSDRKELPRDVIELIRDKNAALRRAGKYPTRENRSRARALQRRKIPYDAEHVRRVKRRFVIELLPPKDGLDPITLDEVSKLIKGLKIRKSPDLTILVLNKPPSCRIHFEGFKIKRKTVAVFFDVAKAFDRVWHAGLIHKLYQLELPDRLVIIIHHYISNRHFSFRLGNTYSSVRPIRAGVPQGSTLSPLLYSAYVNDIPRPSSGVQLALFADDTALYLRSNCLRNILPRLQRAIDELTQWLRLWRIEVNPEKSASIYFNYNTRRSTVPVPIDTPSLKILNQSIPWQHNYKYLGITLDKHLHFRDHVSG